MTVEWEGFEHHLRDCHKASGVKESLIQIVLPLFSHQLRIWS